MDTQEFIRRVMPSTGNYVMFVGKAGNTGGWNRSFETQDKFLAAIRQTDETENTVYYAVGTHRDNVQWIDAEQRNKISRRKDTAHRFKTLAVDIDVGPDHKYKTRREAGGALLQAIKALTLPDPLLVSSGRGIHCYWPLTTEISADDWERLSMMLSTALDEVGMDFDHTKIHDRSMVLRPVGAHHKKDPSQWAEVKCVQVGVDTTPRDMVALLSKWKNAVKVPAAQKHRQSAVADAILTGNGTPIVLDTIRACKQIDTLLKTGGRVDINGEAVGEHLWRASLGIAKFCDDPRKAIIMLASGHDDFDIDDNMRKLDGWKGTGPTTCAYFEQACPKACEGCKYMGKIASPAVLTIGTNVAPTTSGVTYKLPRGYSYKNGWVVYRGPGDEEDTPVCPILIVPISQYTDVERKGTTVKLEIHYAVEGPTIVEIPHTALAGQREFEDFLAAKQLWMPDGAAKKTRTYIVSYLRELKASVATSFMYEHFGWQSDGTYLTNDGLVTETGETRDVQYVRMAAQIKDHMTVEGSLDKWVAGTAMFDHPDLKYHGFAFLVGLSGPLMKGTSVKALLVNMYSPDSGSGKTITGYYALSAWGNPNKLFMTPRDTEQAIYKRLGTLSSTAAYIDEITMIELDRMRSMAYALSEGRERIRGTAKMQELQIPSEWNMPVLSSSNQDLYSLLDTRLTSEAEKMRILQLQLDRVEMFNQGGANIGYKVMHMLAHNYGHAGKRIAEAVMKRGGMDWIKQRYSDLLTTFPAKYDLEFTGPERFIQAAYICAEMMGALLTEEGLIKFNYETQIRNAVAYLRTLRGSQLATNVRGVDIINQYLLEHSSELIIYRSVDQGANIAPKQFAMEPVPKKAVGRLDLKLDKLEAFIGGEITLNRVMLRNWCKTAGIDYRHLVDRLRAENVKVSDEQKVTLYRGINGMGGTGQSRCLVIDMASHATFVDNGVQSNGVPQAINGAPRLAAVQ